MSLDNMNTAEAAIQAQMLEEQSEMKMVTSGHYWCVARARAKS